MIYPTEKHFINIHTHRKALSSNEWVLRNAFHLLSRKAVSELNYAVSVGLHPWHIDDNFEKNINRVESLLKLENVLALGEIGLDRSVPIAFDLQLQVFEMQLKLAEKYQKTIIIHSVRTYSDLFPYMKNHSLPFILHGYRGNQVQTNQLLRLNNVFFSFGTELLNSRNNVVFQMIPKDRIFMETDAANLMIEEVYEKASNIHGVETQFLRNEIFNSFCDILFIRN